MSAEIILFVPRSKLSKTEPVIYIDPSIRETLFGVLDYEKTFNFNSDGISPSQADEDPKAG